MKKIILFLATIFLLIMPIQAKENESVELTTTFLVVMQKNQASTVNKTLRKQEGVKKVEVKAAEQMVVVTFDAYENTVSNLLKVFKSMGITAAAMETGCFGSKEGCINAIKPENTMR
jgi:uncharacterized FlgJ-related protein